MPRLLSALVLALALGVTAFGIGTAVYLDRERAPATSPAADQIAASAPAPVIVPAQLHDPLAAAAAVPGPAESSAAAAPALATIEPLAGAPPESAAPVPQAAALEAPAAQAAQPPAALPLPRPTAAEPQARYWVEYGVFVGPVYAQRLQQALARNGLDSTVVKTHGRNGRALMRVRSAPLADLAAARQAAGKAEAALRIATLVHRGSPEAGAAEHYWVQFGAFPKRVQAARLSRRLTQAGLAATVSSVRGASGKPLYLVRLTQVPTHALAVTLAQRGRKLAEVDCLVGVARPGTAHHRVARALPRHLADSR